ncbi:MAG TPA: hypothetical protein VJ911_07775 [Cryomorphaceae bacterium]|nr:hypothetical protein [Cryomorphaceae bacterium]
MHPILRNILVVILGIIIGSVVNMAIVMVAPSIIPLPDGVDPSNMEALKEAIPSFGPKHYIFPFLAHALGTLVGAFIAARLGVGRKMLLAIIVGGWFFLGGVMNASMLGTPILWTALDLIICYFPFAFIGGTLAGGSFKRT